MVNCDYFESAHILDFSVQEIVTSIIVDKIRCAKKKFIAVKEQCMHHPIRRYDRVSIVENIEDLHRLRHKIIEKVKTFGLYY